MVKINKHIEIVSSTMGWLSSMGTLSREAILLVLAKHYTKVGITIVNNLSDLEVLAAKKPDLVFLGMKFVPLNFELGMEDPDKIWIADYLDEHNIAYTGSSQKAHELELNKPLAKQRALDIGLKTSPFYVVRQNALQNRQEMLLTFPLFIKPNNRGGGRGIDGYSVVHNFEQLESKIEWITAEIQSDSLVEEYLPGREFSVAILKDENSMKFTVMPIEKIPPLNKHGERLLSGKVKSEDSVCDVEVTDKNLRSKLIDLALNVFLALGARDYGRIDIRLDKSGTPHFLEANLIPSLINGYGSFPKACVLNKSIGYEPMILRIAKLGFVRQLDSKRTSIKSPNKQPLLQA